MAVEHHLVVAFADALVAIDRFLQRKAKRAIAGYDDLVADPMAFLTFHEIRIGPIRRYAVSFVLGAALGILFPCGFGLYLMDHPQPVAGPRSPSELLMMDALLILGPLGCMAILLYMTRGGSLVLHKSGVIFRYRGKSVFCPWIVFDTRPNMAASSRNALTVTTLADATDGIILSKNGIVLMRGVGLRSRQVRVPSVGRVVISNLYKVRLSSLGELLTHLGQRLGPIQPPAASIDVDFPVPDDMV